MPKKVTEKQEPVILRGRDALKHTCLALGIKLGKRSQTKKSATCNPKSVRYDRKVAKRRAKNKARRKFNARMRVRRG